MSNVEGDCVYYLRKLTDVFRVALTAVGMTIDQSGNRLSGEGDGWPVGQPGGRGQPR